MKLAFNGWGQPHDGLNQLSDGIQSIDYTRHKHVNGLWDELRKTGKADLLIGWSLGGQLAMQAVLRGVLEVKKLVLIAPPFQFIADANFPQGMDPLIYETFRGNYAGDPGRTAARFTSLIAKGDLHEKKLIKRIAENTAGADSQRWLPWLDALGGYSIASEEPVTLPPTLLLHGENDAIVPFAQSGYYQQRFPQITVEAWKDAGHAPHWHDEERFKMRLQSFLHE